VLGYGFGGKVFIHVYNHSNPPKSPFPYWHPHQYWLYVLFAQGLAGLALHAAAWFLLMLALMRRIFQAKAADERAPALLMVHLIVFVLVYGLADWPSGQVHVILLWSIPAALVFLRPPPERASA
jgi:O-antigen ligase